MTTFRKATRTQVKLKIGVQGPSGSGKTLGALALAFGLAPTGKVAVIDTENGSASLYADKYNFDTLELAPPYTSKRYLEALESAVQSGYEVVVIDSISHQWAGEGGVLDRKGVLDSRPGSNSYTNWASFTKEHEEFKAKILQANTHVICTLRAKQDYILETNDRGRQQPKKVGMAPIQREGMEYELSIVFEVAMDHQAAVSKDRTGLFDGRVVNLLDKKVPAEILSWLASGSVPESRHASATPTQAPPAATDEARPARALGETVNAFAPTDKQIAFYLKLVGSPALTEEERKKAHDWLPKATRQTIKDQIDALKNMIERREQPAGANP